MLLAPAGRAAWPVSSARLIFLTLLGLQQGQPLWWLQLLAMALLLHLLDCKQDVRQAAWLGWLFASAWLSATFAWLYTSMHTYGGLPGGLALLAVLALAGSLALYYAAISWIFRAITQYRRGFIAISFASLWLLAELARGTWLTGFGWGAIGYAHTDGPLAALFSWIGVYGVTAVAALLAGLLAQLARSASWGQARTSALLTLGLLAVTAWWPGSESTPDQSFSVQLLQGNIAQEEKFQPHSGIPAALAWYGTELANSSADLVITPETALAVLPDQLPAGYWQALDAALCQRRASRPGWCAAWQLFRRLYQLCGRFQTRTKDTLALRQAPSGAFWRVHPTFFPLVHRLDAHPAGRLQSG